MANVLDVRHDPPVEAQPSTPEDEARRRRLTALSLIAGLAAREAIPSFAEIKDHVREAMNRDPIDTLLTTVLGGGLLFYLAEREVNPRCTTYWDAVLYVATSLSVGFDDVFPKTAVGNALAAGVQTFGPAMAAAALSPTAASERAASEELLAVNKAILARLDEIARALSTPR